MATETAGPADRWSAPHARERNDRFERYSLCCQSRRGTSTDHPSRLRIFGEDSIMSLGLILAIVLIVFLLGGFSGRFGGYGYGYGHGGIGVLGTVLIIVVVLMLLGRI